METIERIWVRDTGWERLTVPRKCRAMAGRGRRVCSKDAYFALKRSNGPWAYCEEHMYGRRIHNGIVEVAVVADSPAARLQLYHV